MQPNEDELRKLHADVKLGTSVVTQLSRQGCDVDALLKLLNEMGRKRFSVKRLSGEWVEVELQK